MTRALSDTRPVPRRWLNRVEAAIYTTLSPTKFDELVRTGRLPTARWIDGRKFWDLVELDLYLQACPRDHEGRAADDNDWKVAV
jgi:hypothetical protein